jgi:hypothetical protein
MAILNEQRCAVDRPGAQPWAERIVELIELENALSLYLCAAAKTAFDKSI